MLEKAIDFFNNQKITLKSKDLFFETDLSKYFEMTYGAKPYFSESGFIKIVKEQDHYIFSEHMFYDWQQDKTAECYVSIPGINLIGTNIQNTEAGKQLSKRGYWKLDHTEDFINGPIQLFKYFNYSRLGCEESMFEPYATYKYCRPIWSDQSPVFDSLESEAFYKGVKEYMNTLVSYSQVLQSLDAYDVNALEWRKGRAMTPHNGLDYRSMINLIFSNTDNASSSRKLYVGEYDWYDTLFYCAKTQDWEPLIDIKTKKNQYDGIISDTKVGVLVNVFNPKFYHQVGRFNGEGSLFVCTANKTFKSITDRFQFSW